ncbi:MAG: hypothetical protein ABIO21_04735 [Pseudomonas sp.]
MGVLTALWFFTAFHPWDFRGVHAAELCSNSMRPGVGLFDAQALALKECKLCTTKPDERYKSEQLLNEHQITDIKKPTP